mgnify:CR=1 FL=1
MLREDRELSESVEGRIDDLAPHQAHELRSIIARLRLAPSAARAGERMHAVAHKEVKRCPHYFEALVSLANRHPEISKYIKDDPDNLMTVAKPLQKIRHGRDACRLLGVSEHPEGKAATSSCDAVHFEIFYRADSCSKFMMPAPKVSYLSIATRPAPVFDMCVCDASCLCDGSGRVKTATAHTTYA